jgi:4-hydroxy-4-methyl-2-oxoglutarate aldolase
MSKSHPRQWTIEESVERPDPDVVSAIGQFPTTQIADSGGPVGVVGPPIRPLAGGSEICGTAVTVWTKPGDILFTLKATDLVRDGDVLVIDGGGREDAALIGDIVVSTLATLGCRGVVVDGAVRDLAGIEDVGLPVFGRNAHPATGSNDGPGAINVPIQCGGVLVQPGDIVRADSSGVVVIPRTQASDVLSLTRAVDEREQAWRAAIDAGATLPAATGIDERIATLTGQGSGPEAA